MTLVYWFLFAAVVFTCIYGLFYLAGAIRYFTGFKKYAAGYSGDCLFSIVIPARNEDKHIADCLTSIINQQYPEKNFEIIVVDDESTDKTNQTVSDFIRKHPDYSIRLISLRKNNHKKKGALTEGIANAKHDTILTRDADTVCGSEWLSSIAGYIKKKCPDLLICPVNVKSDESFLSLFQEMENVVLQSSGGGMALMGFPYLCNGANLMFSKKKFDELKGYAGSLHLSSGDDIFLLEKFRRDKRTNIQFLPCKDSAVTTFTMTHWKSLIQQKIRWAGKFRLSVNPVNTASAILFTLTHFLVFCALIILLINEAYLFSLYLILLKTTIDYVILILSFQQMNMKRLVILPFISAIIPFYILYVFAGVTFMSKQWKGRK